MYYNLSKIEEKEHECSLPLPEDVVVTFISDGYFVMLRRHFRKFFMINEKNKYARCCFKSTYAMAREKNNHLKSHYYMIHPFSKAREVSDIFVCTVIMLSMLTIKQTNNLFLNVMERICDLIMFLDIFRHFLTGIYRNDLNNTSLRPSRVACAYLKSWFIVDVIAVGPEYITHTFYSVDSIMVLLIDCILKFTRVIKFMRLFNNIQEHKKLNVYVCKGFKLFLMTVMCVFWMGYAMYLIVRTQPEKWSVNREMALFSVVIKRSFLWFFLMGTNTAPTENIVCMILEMMLILAGYSFYIYSSIQFVLIMNAHNAATNKNQFLRAHLAMYADYKNLPAKMKYYLESCVELTFHRSYFNEELIKQTISGQVKKDVENFFAKKFSMRIQVFQSLPVNVVVTMLSKMRYKLFLANDVVCKAGVKGKLIYFIVLGAVAVYSQDGDEICHLYDGQFFGEISAITDSLRIATVKAVETCKIYWILFKDLEDVLAPYPEVIDQILRAGKKRLSVHNRNAIRAYNLRLQDEDEDLSNDHAEQLERK